MRLNRIKIKTLLAEKDIRQKDLIKSTGLTRSTVSSVFCGKSCTLETGEKIAAGLGVKLADIIEKEVGA